MFSVEIQIYFFSALSFVLLYITHPKQVSYRNRETGIWGVKEK
jgi:hypothetical protein